jgi:predicted PurR-regulated permease PerM
MAASPRTAVLRLTPFSVVRAVVMLGLTLAAIGVGESSQRVIGWVLAAVVLAGLLHPLVERFDRLMPRPLALAFVMLFTIGFAAGIAYVVVDEVVDQMRQLQEALPSAAHDLEQSDSRFGEVARDVKLEERATAFVDELPERLRGGDVQDALRTAATRGVAFLATTVLTIFFLIYGPSLLSSAVQQLPEQRRREARRIGLSVYRRTWNYVAGSLAMSIAAGSLTYVCADLLDLPGKAALALWMALLDPIPLVGVALGALPLILLAGATSSWQATVLVALVLVAWQVFEGLRLQQAVERDSLHIGPFVTVAVVMVALVVYGIGGALVSLVLVVALAATLDELAQP